ncbi:MAG TPA: hypothetical protein VK629_09315 [Steroidobacteraceae bacterium]|nr:hypothetical protein [Steroidobacteraceae bacterium]
MRALLFLMVLTTTGARADLWRQPRDLAIDEQMRLLEVAKKDGCAAKPMEVTGLSHESSDEKSWQARARVYSTPRRGDESICKSRICTYAGTQPRRAGKPRTNRFSWTKVSGQYLYSVWLSSSGNCLERPSSKTILYTPVEENTLLEILRRQFELAEEGRAWARENDINSGSFLDDKPGALEAIIVEDNEVFEYALIYAGRFGLQIQLGTRNGQFVVKGVSTPSRP